MAKEMQLHADGRIIRMTKVNGEDYVCLTDIARQKNADFPADVVRNWMRSKATVAFLGLWEQLHNPDFKLVEFDQFRDEAGSNAFVLPPQVWIEKTNAIGMFSKSGRYGGGTFAHHDIAFEFASWVSVEFKLYLITDYQRLKVEEQRQLGWSAKRELAKINYRIHTDAIQTNLIPAAVTRAQMNIIYANEMRPRRRRRVARRAERGVLRSKIARGRADVLNVALFGKTHQQWQRENPTLKGNQRDYADINQLICISNMENINAVMINDGISQPQRLKRLNEIAIHQMRVLSEVDNRKLLK